MSTADLILPHLFDVDNDGDLDLLASGPHVLFLNDGAGVFDDARDRSGIRGWTLLPSDWNADGFADAVGFDDGVLLYRNRGNDNHWLHVELVGVQSNRNGVGARLTAIAGDRRQTRQILGGTGLGQPEMAAHFGLDGHDVVDELVVEWPSGARDVVRHVAADRRVRVIEGTAVAHTIGRTEW